MSAAEMAYGVPMVSVLGECYCVPYPVDLTVKKKMIGFSDAHTDVLDVNGNLLLQIDGKLWQLRKKRIMRDPAGFPILTMREKVSVNIARSADFKRVLDLNCYTSKVKDNCRLDDFLLKGKESFGVRVFLGVDYAFIVSLVGILNETDLC